MHRWPVLLLLVTAALAVATGCASSASGTASGGSDAAFGGSVGGGRAPGATTSTTSRSTEFRTTTGGSGEVLAVVGDSITNEGRLEIASAFDRDRRVVIDGRPGFLIGAQQPTASALAAMRPSIVIVNLGTNDAVFAHDAEESAVDLLRVVDTFTSARCIVLATVNSNLPRSGATSRALSVNRTIRAVAAGDPRVRVVDLDGVVASAASDPTFAAPFFYDDIHPTAAGQARIAAAYVAAVASCPS